MVRRIIILAAATAICIGAQQIEFNRDIRPILSDRCFTCHGPDATQRQAGLRLDLDGGARAVQEELLRRVSSNEPSERMPPPTSGKVPLSEKQVDLLKTWLKQGAPWQPFWSFIPPKRAQLPSVKNTAWPRNAIDRFILARLEREGLAPSPEAAKHLLIRRLSLDLTGLPPTPAEVKTFVEDNSPDAYEQQVDRLLASPRYGERMAYRWMENARYGDTNGYQTDGARDMWRWRDWVIAAFNSNMHWDRFTVEQLAGDLLPDATLEQRIASGFNRNHRTTGEGGIIPEEYRVEYVADRAQTTATVWMGLTVGCARCHDHKYDPISQKDFYRLFAFFNQVPDERGFTWNYGPEEPFVKAPTPEQQQKLASLEAEVQSRRTAWQALQPIVSKKQPRWHPNDWTPTRDLVFRSDVKGESQGEPAELGYLDPFTFSAWIKPEAEDGAILTHMDNYIESQGHGLFLMKGKVRLNLTMRYTDLGLRVESAEPVKLHEWQHVLVTYDGNRLASGVRIYINGKASETKILFDQNNEPFRKKKTPIRVGSGGGMSFDGEIKDARIYKRALNPLEISALNGDREAIQELGFIEVGAPGRVRKAHEALESAEAARDKFYKTIPTVMVMRDGANRETFLLKRGAYDAPGEKVAPGIPSVFPQLPVTANRLDLAKWLVAPENPLTARVTVNRLWQTVFGAGIVKTVDDFGAQGEFPVHPELLDWLAVEFRESGWDVKALLKMIVMSATYRQSSVVTPELLEKDPDNRLLARGARFRLGPEEIRDQALAASGLLVEKLGGPSVKPYQPAGLWQELSGDKGYVQSTGPDLYRRSLYTYWKRTNPPPFMTNFDAPNREQCSVYEGRTDSPLQALNLMNDITFLEASDKLAARMVAEGGTTAGDRIAYGYALVLARRPTETQRTVLVKLQGELGYAGVASLILNLDEAVTKE
jgi:Protein of unknown function (DUF1553)/Protein of unknown function (DUF1549)/Concanavalin A-like lectin/glucanases superfamily/Planctomycete cytochrome C